MVCHHATHNYVYANQDLHAGLRNSHHHHCTLGHTPCSPDLLCDRHRGHTPTRHGTGTESTMARPGRHPAVVQGPGLGWCMVKEGRTSGPIYCDRPCPCAPVRGGAGAHRSHLPDPRGLPSRIRPDQRPAHDIVRAVMWLSQAPWPLRVDLPGTCKARRYAITTRRSPRTRVDLPIAASLAPPLPQDLVRLTGDQIHTYMRQHFEQWGVTYIVLTTLTMVFLKGWGIV